MRREVPSLTKRSLKNNLAVLPCPELNGGSDQCSIPNAQFSSEGTVNTCPPLSFPMRIEHWKLSIGQIPPGLHSAKLFLRRP